MIIYVGYILGDYAIPVCMGTNREKVQERLNQCSVNCSKWIEEYKIKKDEIIEFD